MTHNARVLALLSDGQPHSHGELYDLNVVAHSRVAALRKQGHTIDCWRDHGVYWYRLSLLDDRGGHHADAGRESGNDRACVSAAALIVEEDTGQWALSLEAAA